MTADQINTALANLGYTADMEFEKKTMTVPGST
jgi:hypothetical protein